MSRQSETILDLSLSRGTLDRVAHGRREPELLKRLLHDPGTRVLELLGEHTRTSVLDGRMRLVLRPPEPADETRLALFLGRDGGHTAYVAVVLEPTASGVLQPTASEGGHEPGWSTLRQAGAALGDQESGILTAAIALANWHERHPCCPRCGGPTLPEQAGWVRRCVRDGSEHFPRTDLAVIMAVTSPDGQRLLLARGPHWPERRLSVLAGFLEPGESLESAVVREVAEEVGLEVTDIDYRGNQPWPFPAQHMVGFSARATATELILDPDEIVEAQWFTRAELEGAVDSGEIGIPPRVSIARRLIEDWLGQELHPAAEVAGPFRGSDTG